MISQIMSRTTWLLASVVCTLTVVAALTFAVVIWMLMYMADRTPVSGTVPRRRRKGRSVGRSRELVRTSLKGEPHAG